VERRQTPAKQMFRIGTHQTTTETIMRIATVLSLVVFCIASCNAIWLYTAPSYNLAYDLYAIDTSTYTVYNIGPIRDAAGDRFTVNAMYYSSTTGLIYGVGNSRATNPLKDGGLMAINPLTAQGASTMRKVALLLSLERVVSSFDSCGKQFFAANPADEPKIQKSLFTSAVSPTSYWIASLFTDSETKS
jgi:hypothetical protein